MATKLGDILLTKKSGTTLELNTNKKYVTGNVSFGIAAKSATTAADTAAADVSVVTTAGSGATNISGVIGEKTTAQPASGYFIRMLASGSGNTKVTEAGWVDTGSLQSASAEATKYFPVTAAIVTQNKPSVNSSGLVTATVTTTAGYTPANASAASNTLQLPVQAAATVTPTESEQTAVTAGKYTTGAVKIAAISSTYVGSDISRNNSESLSVSGKTVSVPAGYYAAPASANVADGSYEATVSSHSISTTPQVTTSLTGTVTNIGTATKPSGTDGVNYWTITPSGSVSTTGVSTAKGNATISTAGYIAAGNSESVASSVNITPSITTGSNRYIVKGSAAVNQSLPSGIASSGTVNRESYIKIGAGYYPSDLYYLAGNGTSGAVTTSFTGDGLSTYFDAGTSSDKNVTITPKYTNTAGYIAAHNSATNSGGTSYYKIKSTTASVSGPTVSYGTGWITEGSKTVASGEVVQNAPTINTANGLITATSTVTEGYVESDTKSATLQLTTMNGATKYATTSNQTVSTKNKYMLGDIVVNKLTATNYTAANIKSGVTIKVNNGNADVYSVAGSFTSDGTITAADVRDGKIGYSQGSKVTGSMPDTIISEGVTSVSGETASRGSWNQTAGYTTARTISAAVFSDVATTGTTYVDISNTTDAPILQMGDYLYINKGYTDNLKISLAKLVPNGSDIKGHNEYLLKNHTAYDNDGTLVSGSIDTMTAANISVNGRTVTLPTGMYTGSTAISKSIDEGTVTTSFTGDGMSTYFTAGTSSNKNVTITPKYTNSAGYIDAHNAINSGGTAYYKIITASPAFDGGTVSGSSDATFANVTTSSTNNGISIQTRYTANRAAVLYNGAVTGWVTVADNAEALAAAGTGVTNGSVYYITGITVPKDKQFTVATTADTALDTTSDLDITNNAYRRVDITNNANGTVLVAGAGSTTFSAGSTTTGSLTVNAYNASGTAENSKAIVTNGKWVATTITQGGTYYGRVTVDNATITSGSANISSVNIAYNSTNSNFNVSGSASIGAPTVGTAGYISSSKGTRNGNTATVATSLAKIAGSTTITGTTTVKPAISKLATPSGVTNAASGNATTTAPSSGVYVAVQTAANTGTLTATPGVTTAGYGTADYHAIAPNTATVGAQASDITYVPITTATPAFDGGGLSGTATASSSTATISDSTNSSGISFTTACTATRADVLYNGAVNGWVSKADNAQALAGGLSALTGKTYYINSVTVAASKSFSVTGVGTTTWTPGSSTTGSLTVSGYNGSTAENNKSIISGGKWVATSVSAAGTYYGRVTVGSGSASSSLTNSGASISTTNNSGVSVTPRHSTTAGYVAASTNVNGTTQYINGVTLSKPSSGTRTFTVTVPDGSSTLTLTFKVDSSGNWWLE